MANSYKDIIITPNRASSSDDPKIDFRGGDSSTNTNVILKTYPTSNGTLSFEGSAGQLFSVTNDLSGSIFSVNDVSGIPSIEVLDTGAVKLAQYSGDVIIGTANTSYTSKLAVSRNYGSSFLNTGSHIQIENANTTAGQTTLGFTFGGVHKAGFRTDYAGNLLFNSLNNSFYFNQDYGSSTFNFFTAGVGSFLTVSGKNVTFPGQILSTANIGYGTGAGGIVTQTTSSSTPVTINKSCGTIIVYQDFVAPVSVPVINNTVSDKDTVICTPRAEGLGEELWLAIPYNIANGSFSIYLSSPGGSILPNINFSIIKSSTA